MLVPTLFYWTNIPWMLILKGIDGQFTCVVYFHRTVTGNCKLLSVESLKLYSSHFIVQLCSSQNCRWQRSLKKQAYIGIVICILESKYLVKKTIKKIFTRWLLLAYGQLRALASSNIYIYFLSNILLNRKLQTCKIWLQRKNRQQDDISL